jgi:phage terminase small subunit
MSLGQANVVAGYRNGNRKAAWITRQNPKIARITELTEEKLAAERLARERAQVKFDLSAERILGELARIGLANMQDYVTVGPDGETRFIDPARLSRDQAAALQEMTIEEVTDHGKTKRRVRYKLADKRAALVDIGRHLGLFLDPSLVNMNVMNYFSERPPTLEEWQREIEAQAEATSVLPQPPCKR